MEREGDDEKKKKGEVTSKYIFSGMDLASSASSNHARYVVEKASISSILGEPDLWHITAYGYKGIYMGTSQIMTGKLHLDRKSPTKPYPFVLIPNHVECIIKNII